MNDGFIGEMQGTESSKSGAENTSLGCSACVVAVHRTFLSGALEYSVRLSS